MQKDGNLVGYDVFPNKPFWSSKTVGKEATRAVMQGDGNFVVYGETKAFWASNTHGKGGALLVLQDDREICICKKNMLSKIKHCAQPVWCTDIGI